VKDIVNPGALWKLQVISHLAQPLHLEWTCILGAKLALAGGRQRLVVTKKAE